MRVLRVLRVLRVKTIVNIFTLLGTIFVRTPKVEECR